MRAVKGLVEDPDIRDDVFNVANGQQTTLNQVAAELEEITGKKLNSTHKDPRAGDIRDSYADVSKINQFDFIQHTSLSEGLAKYVESLKSEA